MILTIDIGNTTIAVGVVKDNKVLSVECFDTSIVMRQVAPHVRKVLKGFAQKGLHFHVAAISSVVPEATVIIERIIKKEAKIRVIVAGKDIIVPMKNLYKNPKQVGQDRLVGAYAAMHLYGKPLIVIDLGTAITFDCVSLKGEYMGGAIVPGLRLSAESLFLKTALLPKIDIQAPKSVIGRTTQESILSGLLYGYGSLCRGMIELLSKKVGNGPAYRQAGATRCVQIVMTGGHTHLMKKFIASKIRIIDEHLVHKGLFLLVKSQAGFVGI